MPAPRILIGAVVAIALTGAAGAASSQELAEPEYAAISGTASFVSSSPAESVEQSPGVPSMRAEGYRSEVMVRADDPRLSGRLEAISNYFHLVPGPEGGLLRTGRARLSNDGGGSWVAEFHGFAQPGTSLYTGSHYAIQLTGEGDYAGLSAMLLFLPTGGGEWDLNGVLFPGPLPEFPPLLGGG